MEPPAENASPSRRWNETVVLIALVTAFLVISVLVQKPFRDGADRAKAIGTIIAAALTLMMYSFLYRDNPLFKVAENLYVGVALGYSVIRYTWRQGLLAEVVEPVFFAPTTDALLHELIHRSFPILLGLLLLTRLSRKHGWLSRYSYAVMVGWGSGVGIVLVTRSQILKQLYAAVSPFQAAAEGGGPAAFSQAWLLQAFFPVLGSLAILIGTVAVLFYFFFSIQHQRAAGAVSRVGIWFLMISFGAAFGYTVMARVSLLIGRVYFLLFEWLKLPT